MAAALAAIGFVALTSIGDDGRREDLVAIVEQGTPVDDACASVMARRAVTTEANARDRLVRHVVDAPAQRTGQVVGIVRTPEGPVAGAAIQAVLHDGVGDRACRFELPLVESQECGGFVIDLEPVRGRVSALLAHELRLSLHASKHGYVGERLTIERPFAIGEENEITVLMVRDGDAATVVAVDAAGNPLEGATVWLLEPDGPPMLLGQTVAPDGGVEAQLTRRQRRSALVAVHPVHGSSLPVRVDRATARLVVDQDLARAAGIVRFPGGQPAAGLEVEIEVLSRNGEGPALGCNRATAVTDAEGRFLARGLTADAASFSVSARAGGCPAERVSTMADGTPAELVLGRSLLTVTVADCDDAPLHDAVVRALVWPPATGDGREGDGMPSGLVVDLLPPQRSLWLEPGSRVMLEATLAGADRQTATLHTGNEPGCVRHAFELVDQRQGRGIVVHVTPPLGVSLRATYAELETDFGPLRIGGSSLLWLPHDGRLAVTPGRYQLRVTALADGLSFVPVHADVEVFEGSFSPVRVDLQIGARLRIDLYHPGTAGEPAAALPGFVLRTAGMPRLLRLVPVPAEGTALPALGPVVASFVADGLERPGTDFELTVSGTGSHPAPLPLDLAWGVNRIAVVFDDQGRIRHWFEAD